MNNKKILFGVVTVLVLAMAIGVSFLLETDRIYTHFFYIPIALSAVVFPKYTNLMGIALAALHLAVEHYFRDNFELIALLRAGIMILVSYFLHFIWHQQRDYRQRIDQYDYHRYNDALTGAYNHRHFKELDVDRLWYPVSMMMIQLDNYVDLHTQYGQIISDVYISEISKILRAYTRSDDQLLRVSDHVFILLFEHCDPTGFKLVKDRVYDQLNALSTLERNPELFPEPFAITTKVTTANSAKDFKKSYDIITS